MSHYFQDCALPGSIDELDKFQEDHDEGDSSSLSEEDGSLSEDSWSEEDYEAIDPSLGCSTSPWRQPLGSQPPLMDQPVPLQEPPTEVHSPPSSPSAKRPCRQWTRGVVRRGRGRGKGSSRLQNGGASCPSNSQSPPPCTNPDLQGERWMDREEPDRKPALHPFAPARTPGAQLDLTKEYSPLDLFQLTFSQNTIKTLCFNTNKKASQKQTRGWKTPWSPVTPDELLRCFGVVISMGLVQCPEIRDYWSSRRCYSLPFPRSVFARNRFEAIIQALHMSDPDEDQKNDALKGTDKYDSLFRLRPLIGDVVAACRAFYQPRQQLSIDERMVATKRRFGMKQYMKAKPTKWGFKLFVLSDSSNGYTCDFNIYTSKQKSQSGKGMSQDAVIKLLTPYFGTGYHVYVDNWYTSTSLFTELKQRRFGACGTYRENGTGFPVVQANDMPKKAARGTIKWLRKDDVLYVKWMDSREVRMCSTFHKAFEGDTVGRKVKSAGGTWAISQVPIPASVRDYNKYMGGVDLPDAQLKYYSIRRKTTKWYKVLLFHFIDLAIVNGFLLHKELAAHKQSKMLTRKEFREVLVEQLVNVGAPMPLVGCTPPPSSPRALASRAVFAAPAADVGASEISTSPGSVTASPGVVGPTRGAGCLPVPIVDPERLLKCQQATVGRRRCVRCTANGEMNLTPWRCCQCGVSLCIIPLRNCFYAWHQ